MENECEHSDKSSEQEYIVALFIMLYKVVLTFEYVDEILKCDHSNESYWAVVSCGTVYYAVQSGSRFWSVSGTLNSTIYKECQCYVAEAHFHQLKKIQIVYLCT